MGGGLLQLIAVGQIDEYLSINPELSFYQYVFKRHTNFAMESRNLKFDKKPTLSPDTTTNTVDCVITRHGDLLGQLYFCFTLPDIYSSDQYRFQWVKNVGNIAVKKATVFIDGTQIDQTTGEWMNVWNELSLPSGDTKYDQMIGNVPEMQTPRTSRDRVTIKNNKFQYFYYPETTKESNIPSIRSRQVMFPLNFWFTKKPSLALPLLRLQFNVVKITIEMESSEKLYQVYSKDLEMFVSPSYYNEIHNEQININTFVKEFSLDPYVEANYIFLAEEERNTLFMKSKLTYLVEQLNITSSQTMLSTSSASTNINITTNNPTKELIWTTTRDDINKYNDFMNYSPDIPETTRGILEKAQIRFYNNDRIEEKSAEYFNMIQPYQYHSKVPRQGIYSYSFSLYPEKEFLSGYYNAALVNTNLYVYSKDIYNNDYVNKKLEKLELEPYLFNFLVNVYAITYNIFEIVGNQSGMKFAN
jgi:hypothetical protein